MKSYPHAARAVILAAAGLVLAGLASATPSSTFWAPSTPAVQPYGVFHVTYDTYFGTKSLYPVDTGIEVGVLPMQSFQAEVGFDLGYPTYSGGDQVDVPIYLNGKVGGPEGALFGGAPAWSLGIYAAGFEDDVTDYNVSYAMLGKTFSSVGFLAAGGYYGLNENLMRSSDGETNQAGFMASWFSPAISFPGMDHINLCWDVQTGKNALGATGGGVYFYLTPKVDLAMGPVFFFDEDLQPGGSSWMWSMQLDADIDF